MKTKVTDMIFAAVLLLIVLFTLCIWPFGVVKVKYESKSLEAGAAPLGPITETNQIIGSFSPGFSKLNAVGMRFSIPNREENPGFLIFELADEAGALLYSETVNFSDMANSSYYPFQTKIKLDTKRTYSYCISAYNYGENPPSVYVGSLPIGVPEHNSFSYAGTVMYNNAPLMILEYDRRADLPAALPYLIISCVLCILLLAAWNPKNLLIQEKVDQE